MELDIEFHIANIRTALATPRSQVNRDNAEISLGVLAKYARIGALRTQETEVPTNIVNPVEYE